MMCLDYLDICIITNDSCRQFHQFETQVDPDTHIRRKHHGAIPSRLVYLGLLFVAETGRSNNQRCPMGTAGP